MLDRHTRPSKPSKQEASTDSTIQAALAIAVAMLPQTLFIFIL